MSSLLERANVSAITLVTEDLAGSKAFYQEALGLATVFEDDNSAVFQLANTVVNVLDAAAAPELLAPAEVGDADAGPRFVLTIGVGDVDAVCAELSRRGVQLLNGPMDRPWGVRTASFTDPAGHVWELAQDLPQGAADA